MKVYRGRGYSRRKCKDMAEVWDMRMLYREKDSRWLEDILDKHREQFAMIHSSPD